MADNQIGLEAIFDMLGFNAGADEYNSKIKDLSSETNSASSFMSDAWTGLAAVGEVAFAAIAAGVAALTVELGLAANAAMDTEEVLTKMEFIVDNVGERTGVASEDVLALADGMSKIYPIDDEVIAQAAAMGLTFDGVNKDNLQPLLEASADLAQWTGKDLPATMKSLSLAKKKKKKAARLLKEANITLTDSEMDVLKGFKETGDSAGATQFLLEQLRKKGILGLGTAMGETAKGKLTIMQTALGNLQESLGTGLLDAMKGVFDKITEFANNPKVIGFFTEVGARIGEFASAIIDKMPSIISVIEDMVNWFVNNKAIVVGVLAAIGVAMAVFAATSISAAVSAAAAFAPVIAVMAVVGAAVALLYQAWQEDWGGIRTAVLDAWKQVKPVFDNLQKWLAVNVPKAVKALSAYWTGTLLPAIKSTFEWIAKNVIPILVDIVLWLGDNVPKAIKAVSGYWTGTLLPALKAVYDFIQKVIEVFKTVATVIVNVVGAAVRTVSAVWTGVLLPAITAVYNFFKSYIMPVLQAVANLISAVLGVALRVLAGLWQNVLLPALSSVYNFLASYITPVFNSVASVANGVLAGAIRTLAAVWQNVFLPAVNAVKNVLTPFASFLSGTLYSAFNGIRNIIQYVVDKINQLANSLRNLTLPDWLTPGSPTPWELGLRGINAEMAKLAGASLPAMKMQLDVLRDVASGGTRPVVSNSVTDSSQRTTNYLYGAQFNVNSQTNMIQALQGL